MKANARRRGKAWSISIEEFTKLCIETGYIDKKGRKSQSMSIDRIDESKGYSIDNVRVIPFGLNSQRRN